MQKRPIASLLIALALVLSPIAASALPISTLSTVSTVSTLDTAWYSGCSWWYFWCYPSEIYDWGTTLVDSTPPVISGLAVSDLTTTGANVAWSTDEDANTTVVYGTTVAYGVTAADMATYGKTHSVDLGGLQPKTDYHFQAISFDQAGNKAASADTTFTTPAPPAPVISAVGHAAVTSVSATVSWTTTTPADSTVEYGTTAYDKSVKGAVLGTSHSLIITGLSGGRTYIYRVRSTDAYGQEAVSEDATKQTFTTPAQTSQTTPTGSGDTTVTVVLQTAPLLKPEPLIQRYPAGTGRLMTIEEKAEQKFSQSADVWVSAGVKVLNGTTPIIFDFSYAAAHGIKDADHDAVTDTQEAELGTKPNNQDSDGDGLTDGFEKYVSKTNPLKSDTDGDGVSDEVEVMKGTDPNK